MSVGVVDLFSGCGGLSFGFHAAAAASGVGMTTLAAVDSWRPACESFERNLGVTPVCAPVTTSRIASIGRQVGVVDLLLGGPPCQGFSTVGRRALDDPRNRLVRAYMHSVRVLRPKVFVMENVSGFVTLQGGRIFSDVVRYAERLGYDVHAGVLLASAFGVPQHRRRCFLVGVPKGGEFVFPSGSSQGSAGSGRLEVDMRPAHLDPSRLVTFRDATSDLPPVMSGGAASAYLLPPQNAFQRRMRAGPTQLSEHSAPRHSTKLLTMMRYVPEGSSAQDPAVSALMPPAVRPTSGFGNTYARIRWDAPAPTITRNFSTPSAANCIHPEQDRALTLREAARCQSFPDSFVFEGSQADRKLQVGNAVPPGLAEALAGAVLPLL